MNRSAIRPVTGFVTLAVALCLAEAWAAQQLSSAVAPKLVGLAVTVDLVVGLPLLFGLLIIRRFQLPWTTLVPIGVFGAIVAYRLLPPEHRTLLDILARLAPLIEISLLSYVALRLYSVWRVYRTMRPTTIYGSEALDLAVRRSVGDSVFAAALVVELLLVGLAFGGWLLRFQPRQRNLAVFSMHRSGLYPAFLFVIICLIIGETLVVHLLVAHFWNTIAAWLLTVLSAYSLLWVVGDFHALRLHPLVLDGTILHLRRGLVWRGIVHLDNIERIRPASARDQKDSSLVSIAPLGQGEQVLILHEPVTVFGLFGMKRVATRIGITVDDKAALLAALGK